MTSVELAVGWLTGHLWNRAQGRTADVYLQQLDDLVRTKLDEDPVLQRLEREAAQSPAVPDRTRRRVQQALEDAAWTDPQFGEELAALVQRLRALQPDQPKG